MAQGIVERVAQHTTGQAAAVLEKLAQKGWGRCQIDALALAACPGTGKQHLTQSPGIRTIDIAQIQNDAPATPLAGRPNALAQPGCVQSIQGSLDFQYGNFAGGECSNFHIVETNAESSRSFTRLRYRMMTGV